jgi:hypothetical protein
VGLQLKSCHAKVEDFRDGGKVTLVKGLRDRAASDLTLSLHQMRARKSSVNVA